MRAIQFLTAGWLMGKGDQTVAPTKYLFVAQVQALGNRQIALVVRLAQVGQHPSAVTHELEQTTPAGLIFFVCTQMIGQLLDTAGHNGDLNFGRAGIIIVCPVGSYNFCLSFNCE